MRVVSVAAIFIVNLVLQSTILQHIAIFDVRPNTAVVLIVCLAFLRDDIEGALAGLFAGLLQDVLYGRFIGYNALLFATIGFLCGKPFKDYFRENFTFPILLTTASIFCYEFITYTTSFLLFGKTNTAYYLGKIIIPSSIYTLLFVFPLYWLMLKLEETLEKHKLKKHNR